MSAVNIGEATITITPDTKGFNSSLNREASRAAGTSGATSGREFGRGYSRTVSTSTEQASRQAAQQSGGAFVGGMKGALGPLAGIVAGAFAVDTIGKWMSDATKAEVAVKRLETTLGNMGQAGAAEAANAFSDALEAQTGVVAEDIKEGQALLATFSEVAKTANEQGGAFERATAAAVDLSAAGFGSVSSASLQLGKALQDPVKGITALARSGVTFTEAQKTQIKAWTKSGEAAKAQNLILGEVEKQVKGVAAATATDSAKMKAKLGEITDEIGGSLLPVVNQFADFFIQTLGPAIQSVLPVLLGLISGLISLATAVSQNTPAMYALGTLLAVTLIPAFIQWAVAATQSAAASVAAFVTARIEAIRSVGSMVVALVRLIAQYTASAAAAVAAGTAMVGAWVLMGVQALLNAAKIALAWVIALGPVGLIIAAIAGVIAAFVWLWNNVDWFREFWIAVWEKVKAFFLLIWEGIKAYISVFIAFYKKVWEGIVWVYDNILKPAFEKIKEIFLTVFGWIKTFVVGWFNIQKKIWTTAFNVIKTVVTTVFDKIKGAIEWVLIRIKAGVQVWMTVFTKIWDKLIEVKDKVVAVFTGVKDAIGNAIGAVKDRVLGFFRSIIDPILGLKDRVFEAAGNIVTGLWEGIKEKGQWLKDKIMEFARNFIPGPIADALGISSPSKVTMGLGQEVSRGLAVGITSQSGLVDKSVRALAHGVEVGAPVVRSPGKPMTAASSSTTVNQNITVQSPAADPAVVASQVLDRTARLARI